MKYSIWTLAPAHMPKMSLGVAQRSLSGMKSIPCCSTLERVLDVRLVNDRQVLGNRHAQYLLVVASAEARTPRRATGGRAAALAAPRQPPSVSRPRTHLSGPGARPWRATEGVSAHTMWEGGPPVKWFL